MPVTRSDMPTRHPAQLPNLKQRHRHAPILQNDPDIIIVSSDDDGDDELTKPNKIAPTKKTSRQREKAPVVIPVGDVLEITSEEESDCSPQRVGTSSSVAELQKKVKILERVSISKT